MENTELNLPKFVYEMSESTVDDNIKVKSLQVKKSSKPVTLQLLYEFNDQNQQTPKILEGLGKATKRGVRTCPKCGVVNGTRGLKCKNLECKYDFKQVANGNIGNSSVNKLLACEEDIDEAALCANFRVLRLLSDEKLFSVERISNISEDANDWGFVYLPLIEEFKTIVGTEGRDAVAYQLMAFCYMRDCISASSTSQSKFRKRRHGDTTRDQFCCDHVKASFLAKNGINSVCPINKNLLESISFPEDIKDNVLKLVCSDVGANPIVQKISDSTYVVRGIPDKNHPIGVTYVFFNNQNSEEMSSGEELTDHEEDFFIHTGLDKISGISLMCWCGDKLDQDFFKDTSHQQCLNLFTCLLALSSDPKLLKYCFPLLSAIDEYYKQMNLEGLLPPSEKVAKLEPMSDEGVLSFFGPNEEDKFGQEVSKNGNTASNDDVIKRELSSTPSTIGNVVTEGHLPLVSIGDVNNTANDVTALSLPFIDWISFVMESIEEAMHYQCSGKPRPLSFHVHQKFFNVLLQRITSSSYKKKRLPDSVESIHLSLPRAPPHGKFTKYTWKIHNAQHVQQIFSMHPKCRLPLSRCFIENKDMTFSKFEKVTKDISFVRPHIQPFHLKTQLKIGYNPDNADYNNSTPFIIEWTPDLFKRSNVGEMRLSFEFNHYRHGKLIKEIEQ